MKKNVSLCGKCSSGKCDSKEEKMCEKCGTKHSGSCPVKK